MIMAYLAILITILGIVLSFVKIRNDEGKKIKLRAIFPLSAISIGILLIIFSCIAIVPYGRCGVVDIFGNISPNALSAGMHAVHPFAVIHKQPVTTQEIKESMHVRSKEGLNIQLDVSCFWHVPEASWPMIMKTVSGADPLVLLVPNFRSVARDISANYEAKALYSADRSVLSNQMKSNLDSILSSRGIVIEETPMRQVTLPANVSDAIEEKLAAEQEAQRMQFVLQKEQQEAERKRIEAQGIKDFQRIVSEGISDKLLQWKGIEATEKIAESTNSKIVIIGAGKDGLPVILNQ